MKNVEETMVRQASRLAVAPMMDWTDRHCRAFHRVLSRRALLYTEMVTAQAILHGDRARLLDFDAAEHPVALQLGGSDPAELASAVRIAADWGYDEINLNVGCPSDRVQSGCFGAVLMERPALVAECVAAMIAESKANGWEPIVSLQANYTWMDAINRSDKPYHDGRRLPGRPEHEAYGRVAAGRTYDLWGGALWLDADYTGNVYLDQANLKEDSVGRLLFGVGARLERPREGLTFTLEIDNLFDTIAVKDDGGLYRPVRDYEAYPLPGRTVLATVHLKL